MSIWVYTKIEDNYSKDKLDRTSYFRLHKRVYNKLLDGFGHYCTIHYLNVVKGTWDSVKDYATLMPDEVVVTEEEVVNYLVMKQLER